MITFDAIKVHDLVYLDENGESGWYIVTDVRVGHHIEVRVLGEFYPLIFLDKEDLGTIHKVIRAATVPEAIAALEMALLVLTSQHTKLEDHADAITLARNALRAVRGEESA